MANGFWACVVLLVSVAAGGLAAYATDVTLSLTLLTVMVLQGVVLAVLVLQWVRHVHQLRDQTALAAFSRDSADVLTRQLQPDHMLRQAAELLSGFLNARVFIWVPADDGRYIQAAAGAPGAVQSTTRVAPLSVRARSAGSSPGLSGGVTGPAHQASNTEEPVLDAVRWSAVNARAVGPGTDNWPTFPIWYVPFSRLPGDQPVLGVDVIAHRPVADTLSFLRGFVDLLAASHDRLQSLQRAHDAELSVERQRLQNRFLASISHDMRTPLTGILGASSTLLEQGEQLSAVEQRHLLEGLHRQVQYLADTTDNILSLLRLQQTAAGEISTDWESPEELLGLVLARFPQATAQGRLQAHAQPVALLVKANATLMVQALVNLVDNALRLNQSFEPVCLQLRCEAQRVEYVVSDRGPGFVAGFDINHVVRPLRDDQSAQSGRHSSSAGLGLGIVQAIARVHGAALHAGNRAGGGAEVVLGLPGTPWDLTHEA